MEESFLVIRKAFFEIRNFTMIYHINDLSAPEVAVFARLTEHELRTSFENEGGIFIAESPNVIDRALTAGYKPISFLMENKHITGDAAFILEKCPEIPVYTADRSTLENLTGYKLTRGVLCAFRRPKPESFENVIKDSHRVVVLENIRDATNMGAIFRSAAALGIDAVLLTPECGDPLSRRCLRVSMGNVFNIKWARISEKIDQWPVEGMKKLKENGFKTLSMALRNNSIDITSSILKNTDKLAILLGTEGPGLLEKTIDLSDYVAKIPMKDGVDSLNVAAAGAIIFWELRK